MVGIRNKKVKRIYSILSLAILSMVGIYTVFGNQVSAAEVYPTIINENNNNISNNNSLGVIISQFINFVKESIAKNNSNNKYSFDLTQDTNNLLNNTLINNNLNDNTDQFIDISKHPDKDYINFLAKHNIITSNNKFHPDNFVRLNDCSKLVTNSYRFRLGYDLTTNIGLTDKNYFKTTMPKYYNTAYELGFFEGLNNIDDFERFILYDDLYIILKNIQNQYPDMVDLDYLNISDFKEPKNNIKRSEIAKSIMKIFKLDHYLNNTQDKIEDKIEGVDKYKYSEAIKKLESLNILDLDIKNIDDLKLYGDSNITRGEFITILVKLYLDINNKELAVSNLDFNIKDLDYNSKYTPFVLYAKEQGMLDYLIEIKRVETYLNIDSFMSRHEVYHILSTVLGIQIENETLQVDNKNITKGEVAEIIMETYNSYLNNVGSNSQIDTLFQKIGFLAEYKKLANMLF